MSAQYLLYALCLSLTLNMELAWRLYTGRR